MRRWSALVLLLTGFASAGGAGQPLSERQLLDRYHQQIVAYARANKASLPALTDCLKPDGKLPQKPAGLKLVACGIAKEDGHLFVDLATASLGLFTTPEPFLLGNTPQQRAVTELTVHLEQFKMRRMLGQPQIQICNALGAGNKSCRVEYTRRDIKQLFFESKEGVRLMYDGQTIKDWPRP